MAREDAGVPMAAWKKVALALAGLLLAGAYVFVYGTGAIAHFVDGAALREYIDGMGGWGPVAVSALMAFSILVSPIPSAPIAMAAGAVYGHTYGTLYVVIGAEIGAIGAFGLSREFGHALLHRWLGRMTLPAMIGSQNALTAIVFTSRLLPFVSFDLVSYAAGLTPIAFWRFAIATLLGIVPTSFLLAHFGLGMTSGDAETFLISAIALGLVTAVPLVLNFVRNRKRS